MSTAKDYSHAAGKGAVSGLARVIATAAASAVIFGGSGFGLGYATGSDDSDDEPTTSETRQED